MITPFKHILVSRTDKIGDLILSLPVFQSLKASFPGVKITITTDARIGGDRRGRQRTRSAIG